MASINKVCLMGNLGRDPEARAMNSGGEVVSFSLATSENWTDKASGERREKTEWHNVVIFNEALAKVAKQYLRKGSTCYIEGAMQTRKYTDRDGNEKSATEVVLQRFRGELVLIGGKESGQSSERSSGNQGRGEWGGGRGGSSGGRAPFDSDLDDDVPF